MNCQRCGFENPAGMGFCGSCGAALLPGTRGASAIPLPLPLPLPRAEADRSAERRQLTVMFCDLVDSTALSYRLDPEELRDVVRSYQAISARVIEQFDGHVAQYLGDGILAYFGFPVALEKEASQAVRAGSGILREVGALNERLERGYGLRVAVRIGLHTGLVVVGEVGAGSRREQLALGDAPNIAARLQAYAEPNSVVLSGETFRLVRREFTATDLGERRIRGIPSPVRIYSLGDEIAPSSGGAAAAEPGDAIFGRDGEMEVLRERWGRAVEGEGQVVLIGGDAGIGKSALMSAFARSAEADGATVLRTRCLPHFRNSTYQPLLDLLRRRLESDAASHPEERRRRLFDSLGATPEVVPLFAGLLGLAEPAEAEGDALLLPQRTERIRSTLLGFLLRASERGPLLLCLDDLQWADPSSLELLGLLAERIPGRPILALLTHRSDFPPPWPADPHRLALSLSRLAHPHAERIMARVTEGRALPRVVAEEIIRRTDGVPLFVEELTRMVLESGLLRERDGAFELIGGAIPPFAIPATLHDSLEARLDRLAATKELAQVGAVIGREFPYRLLREVASLPEPVLRASLDRLVEAGMLVEEGIRPDATYSFKHALIQETAYQSLLRGARQVYHLRVALALEETFPEEGALHPEVVAQHYSAAGQAERAVERWIRAGRRAVERSAVREAITHLEQGLDLLLELDPGPERDRTELALLLALGPALIATRGHASSEVRDLYLSARDLATVAGTPDQHFEVLGGLFTSRFVRSELDEARELAEDLLLVAEVRGDDGSEMAAQVAIGAALLARGRLREALGHLDRGVELYDPARHFALAHGVGQDFGVVAHLYAAFCRAALGMPDQAGRQALRGVELARSLQHPHSLAFALSLSCNIHHFLRRPEEVLRCLEELGVVARREGFDHWLREATAFEGWAAIELGRQEEGLAGLAVESPAAEGTQGSLQSLAARLVRAEGYLRAGRWEEALASVERVVAEGGEKMPWIWWRSETSRIRGRAILLAGRAAEAEAELRRAVETAGESGSPLCLLRALTDLSRYARSPGAREGARERLREVHRSFTEGFDGPDLLEARAALEPADPAAPLPVATG